MSWSASEQQETEQVDIYPRLRNEHIDLFCCNGLANKTQTGILKK